MKAKTLGYSGEALAAHHLESKGYSIVENNFTIRGGEIDLIAREGNTLVFVEVKTRTKDTFGHGDESMNRLKKARLSRTVHRYLYTKIRDPDPDYRVDLIEIELHPETKKLERINHFKDIEL